MLKQDQQLVAIHRQKLEERITAGRVALAPRSVDVLSILPKSVSAMDIQNDNLKGTLWLIHRLLDRCLKYHGPLEFLLNWGSKL